MKEVEHEKLQGKMRNHFLAMHMENCLLYRQGFKKADHANLQGKMRNHFLAMHTEETICPTLKSSLALFLICFFLWI
jgi:hypothetical protein